MAILQDQTMTNEQIMAELAKLRAENARLKVAKQGTVVVKVKPLGETNDKGEPFKGNVSVYGLGRYPVTLYPGQWLRLLAKAEEIKAEIEDNRDVLAWKED